MRFAVSRRPTDREAALPQQRQTATTHKPAERTPSSLRGGRTTLFRRNDGALGDKDFDTSQAPADRLDDLCKLATSQKSVCESCDNKTKSARRKTSSYY